MTLVLELTPEYERLLLAEAARQGQTPAEYVRELLERHLRPARADEPAAYAHGTAAETPRVREPVNGSTGYAEEPSLAADTSAGDLAEEWLKDARQHLHTVAPLIEEDARGVAYLIGTTTKVTEVALNKAWTGQTPESLQADLPHLSLAQIYAALAYYHANQARCDAQIERANQLVDRLRTEAGPSPVAARLRAAGKLR